ncbi:MAG TPA: protein DpdD [Hyphomonadaceae bacterium]|nr:protein DpdD [Hyphomonadaceae bacterium]
MIGRDQADAEAVVRAFKDALPPSSDPLVGAFASTVTDPNFPGALFAWPRDSGDPSVFYAAAQTQAQWRRLRPLLLAFVGPTLTDFSGGTSRLDPTRPHEQVLARSGLAAVVRLVPAVDTATSTERALHRLTSMVARTPLDAEPPVETTGRLLARIRDHLNALAIDDARGLLERCRSEHRLDALNLKFLEIEILAVARDWRAIAAISGFDDLLLTRRPPAVAAALLEAAYWSCFEDAAPTLAGYISGPRQRVRDLIRVPSPPGMGDGAWRLYALEALALGGAPLDLANAALVSSADLGGLLDDLSALVIVPDVPQPIAESPTAEAASSLITADLSGALSAIDQAKALFARLTAEERAAILEADQPRRALAAITDTFGPGVTPTDWIEWLADLDASAFTSALAVARRGAQEWQPGLGDPVEIARLAQSLNAVADAPPASDRLVEGLPHFVAWLQRDADFPRPVGYPVYEAALERLMLSGRAAMPMLDSAGVLARAMLTIGPPPAAYGRLLSDLLEFSGQGAGLRTAYWLMELLEETVASNAPDQQARDRFWQDTVSRLIPIGPQLSPLQRSSLTRLAAALGWEGRLPDVLSVAPDAAQDAVLARRLAGKMVAVYTLTESAGAQASETLKALAPEVDIRINSDHGGTRPLRALAENADLFVVVAASATHAATDFIRMKRGDRPLVYTAGRGAISILRAVEEWALRSDAPVTETVN